MEDENSIELCLGLPCGGSTSKSKGTASDPKGAEGSKNKPVVGNLNMADVSFGQFFPTGVDNPDHSGQHRRENFWTDLGQQSTKEKDIPRYHERWMPDNKLNDMADESSRSIKRKMPFEEINLQKKPEMGDDPSEVHVPAVNSSSLQLAFGYPSVQLPTLETGSSWMLGPKSQCAPSYDRRSITDGAQKPVHTEDDVKASHASVQAPNNSAALAFDGKILDLTKGSGKHAEETGKHPILQIENEANGNRPIFRPNEFSSLAVVEGFPPEGSAIRQGLAPGLKFGGSGSYPDLPWVSTTGQGPNGKTISGVTYKYNKSQVKIVCACHGSHLSPEEFIQHASADDHDTENNTGIEKKGEET